MITLSFLVCHLSCGFAQILIGGNVYGGGNAGNTGGNTNVTVYAGDIQKVYGGARMADVGGHTFVHLDGEHASNYVLVNQVYGGNDISGHIGTSETLAETNTIPAEIEKAQENNIDKSWNAFVRISSKMSGNAVAADNQKIYIGQLFGGGNGDYDYTADNYAGKTAPTLAKTYLEVMGGSIVYAFGGGNNATVTQKTAIYVDNPSQVVSSIIDLTNPNADQTGELLTGERIAAMGYNPGYTYPTSDAYQIGSFFGGNNTAEMAIRPQWNLQSGKIRNLYSGGNKGPMTSPDGLLLQIAENSTIEVDNVYGGCRMADVTPKKNGVEQEAEPITTDDFGHSLYIPGGMSARTRILGGHVNNVYGGNDITGRIKGGNSIGIYTTIYGDVYGGGNGSYPYTDNATLASDPIYGDLYYPVPEGKSSVEALNEFRPDAEQVSIYVAGTDAKKTIVHGGIYLGGNSASLSSTRENPLLELKIGSNVIADKVFLGNNGEHMVETHEQDADHHNEGVLRTYKKTLAQIDSDKYGGNTTRFSQMDLTDASTFATYMDGVTMRLMPSVVFAKKSNGDPSDYADYSSSFGSFYCGGNVGSMKIPGKTTINFNHKVIIYNKLVGGCNNADLAASDYNAAYQGGLLGVDGESSQEGLYTDGANSINDRLELNLSGLLVRPMRWKMTEPGGSTLYTDPTTGQPELEWNTVAYNSTTGKVDLVVPVTTGSGASSGVSSDDWHRRFDGGNIYGGCYNSGHVNGNVVININSSIHEPGLLFDEVVAQKADGTATDKLYDIRDDYTISAYRTGVAMHTQGMDPLGQALNVFGGGKGAGTEIWGSATINLNDGFTFQIFGGSEQGVIGKHGNFAYKTVEGKQVIDSENSHADSRFSTYVNLCDRTKPGSATPGADLAEAVFIYGGGFEGPIAGNSIVHLDNGRLFNSFGGSCNADILGHTETYVGQSGFPYVTDNIYGGNDLGGSIFGTADFNSRLSQDLPIATYGASGETFGKNVTQVSAYTEYVQGRVDYIFGGCYGDYDYSTGYHGYTAPYMDNAFVNFRPGVQAGNAVSKIFGAGQGAAAVNMTSKNEMQNRSYVLIDIKDDVDPSTYERLEVFGAGQNCGVGMGVEKAIADANADGVTAAAVIDLARGQIGAAYGGSLSEGVTRRTIVNVPGAVAGSATKTGSTIKLGSIFAGAYGSDIYLPCDVYEGTVNYNSANAYLIYDKNNAMMKGALYGGNNQKRRTLYGKINIDVPVREKHPTYGMTTATVYGAGCGSNTWNEYTEVNLNTGAEVFEVYGGGEAGGVMSAESVEKYLKTMPDKDEQGVPMTPEKWRAAWTLGGSGYDADLTDMASNKYASNTATNLQNALARKAEMDERKDTPGTNRHKRYNTNVIISEGATVNNYAYGGGLGNEDDKFISSGDVYGTTYIALLGGKVKKDLYAAGTSGTVYNLFGADFTASANAYVKGGTCRNVYGGGWAGSVGYHAGELSDPTTDDIPGETHVVIGDTDGTSLTDGIPAIERNAYGGGEGGAVFGTANITLNKGYIGYRYFADKDAADADYAAFASNSKNSTADASVVPTGIADGGGYYQEKLHDDTWNGDGTARLYDSGNIFGGGYIDNSNVDVTCVTVYGGHVRNALFGGGEIAAIGRGVIHASGQDNSVRTLQGIYKAGHTCVRLYDGKVHRNVFGGGRGYNNLGQGGSLYSDGYVFGQTEVCIYGGEVGTDDELAKGNGNVFGGGDIGYVYSAYENENGVLCFGTKSGVRYDNADEGYYYKYENGVYKQDGSEKILTEDCKVLVEPWCRVKTSPVTFGGKTYEVGDYVPTAYLNTLGNKNASEWTNLEDAGIIIHNAVFAGGNTSAGSSRVYANATSIFGNATASIHDVYHRDLITVGTGHTGGLYGDGNLTFVDGYRGLNITNYGTDYYTIKKEITLDQFHSLPAREAAYYELRYKCVKDCTDKDGTAYYAQSSDHPQASTISADDLITLFQNVKVDGQPMVDANGKPQAGYWQENGVCSRYAGRILNTIQRADFCGVFGSRMVMQGARDRVPEVVDYTNYTINRVREVSLNKKESAIPDDDSDDNKRMHGNYFGIYNIVNYLGALTSDVDFKTGVRHTDNANAATYQTAAGGKDYGKATYEDWKAAHKDDRTRNNGNSHNQVALASGVYLELTSEKSTGTDLNQKDWGLITGVVELDLINVQTGIGGGFVYARNEHGVRSDSGKTHITVTGLNTDAVSQKSFVYDTSDTKKNEWQTSGNFVHSTQVIIDDCYNISGKYKSGNDFVPAHYWYIKGDIYVYDQYISAYTGSPNAYSESVEIPLTITAASHGTMKLLNVQPNYYAYYASPGNPLGADQKIIINDVTYYKNDPISYWTYNLLSASEKQLFVRETYVTIGDCKVGDTEYPEGTVLLPAEYESLRDGGATVYCKNDNGEYTTDAEKGFDFFFRSSNNMSHDTGYILTYKVNNPTAWDVWYTKAEGTSTDKKQDNTYGNNGPTYHKKETAGLLGQRHYKESDIISKEVYDTYQNVKTRHSEAIPTSGQAIFVPAYIVTSKVNVAETSGTHHLNEGAIISKTYYDDHSLGSNAAQAYVCTSTIQLSPTEFIYLNSTMTEAEKNAYKTANPSLAGEIDRNIVPAYYCTTEGQYGGDYYETGRNYRGLAAWSSMSAEDRKQFDFNYDALDLLIDPAYSGTVGQKYQYDASEATLEKAEANPAQYSLAKPVDYTATYHGSDTGEYNGVTLANGQEYSRADYEKLPNEKRHYAGIVVETPGDYYVVNTPFQLGNSTYAVGTTISETTYHGLGSTEQDYITQLSFTQQEIDDNKIDDVVKPFYYCREEYKVGQNGSGESVADKKNSGTTYNNGSSVPIGTVISASDYGSLVNKQTDFTIHGIAPSEVSTLYVSRESDIFDLTKEKIITVIYQYDYEESDASGNITPLSERHVLNIHVQFKSGIPLVEDIKVPQTVLPGDNVSLRDPEVTPGAYEIMGGGWEIFQNIGDAESHTNGVEYSPNQDPLYWYQDGHYVAYYAKTYLGKTYSNHVPLSVANYHDMDRVMQDKSHHMYVDNPDVKRHSKIYIDNRTCTSDPEKSELDLLSDFFNLSAGGKLDGHAPLDGHVANCQNLDFILYSDVSPKKYTSWTPIGTADHCFGGWLHGNGYTVSGLDKSLFGSLCGNIYNIGVMGSFTSGGIADSGSGHIENVWVSTSATPDGKPVVGDVSGNPYVYNSYYPSEQHWTDHAAAANLDIIKKPMADFVNGRVAYLLNSNYLQARYLLFGNKSNAVSDGDKVERPVFFSYPDGTFDEETVGGETKNKEYRLSYTKNTSEWPWHSGNGFVEEYMGNGDFRYSDGIIPKQHDVSYTTDSDGRELFIPVFPDDYIYFGQTLSYDLYNSTERQSHDLHPTGIAKYHTTQSGDDVDNSKHLLLSLDPKTANRVFRAPAYFRNGIFGRSVMFNASAAFAGSYTKDAATYKPHEGLTAIDFSGQGDITGYSGVAPGAEGDYKDRSNDYAPLLDYDGLTAIRTSAVTRNLLAYAPSAEAITGSTDEAVGIDKARAAATSTLGVLTTYFREPAYAERGDDASLGMKAAYRAVDAVQEANMPRGHLVQMSGTFATDGRTYTAPADHFLVDRQDFNAPIAYKMGDGYRMWYQRTPDRYAGITWSDGDKRTTTGWDGISLPFEAELVTTHQKGEITHFYDRSQKSKNGDNSQGHEYWLRGYGGGETSASDASVFVAQMNDPSGGTKEKAFNNTFLWDYYYSHNDRDDANRDDYQQQDNDHYTYYQSARTYQNYARLNSGTAYIIGFPGQQFCEFDLSGSFTASTALTTIPAKLDRQVITFASETGVVISKSDLETGTPASGYTFRPNYLNESFAAGSATYTLNAEGSSYDVVPAAGEAVSVAAFRPYFVRASGGGARTRSIIFGDGGQSQLGGDEEHSGADDAGTLLIRPAKSAIVVSSSLRYTVDVRIFSTTGVTLRTFTIRPGQTVETPVLFSGVYIVRSEDGQYTKKLSVK